MITGLSLQLVKSCRYKDANIGYENYLIILIDERKKGNYFNIDKLNKLKRIKFEDAIAMRDLPIFLMSYNNLIGDLSQLNQLNSPNEIYKIIMKLKFKIRDRWRKRIRRVQKEKINENFDDFTRYVHEQSYLLNLPLYGNIADITDEKVSHKSISNGNSIFYNFKKKLNLKTCNV